MADDNQLEQDLIDALSKAAREEGIAITVKQGIGDRINATTTAGNLASNAAKNILQTHLQRELCRDGYLPSITCRDDKSLVWTVRLEGRTFIVGFSKFF